jgi:hypothetical protein
VPAHGGRLWVYVDRLRTDNDACDGVLDHLAIRKIYSQCSAELRSGANRLHDKLLQPRGRPALTSNW